MNDDLLVKYEKELDLRYKFQNENDALRVEVERLEGYEKLFKEGKINHHRNPHKKVVKIKGEILGAQSAYDHALMKGLGNMSVSTGLIIDLVDYAQQSDKKIAELENAQPKWISVEDESPELGVDVLVFPIKMHLGDEPVYTAHRTKSWGFEYIWCNTIYNVKGVTHWASLPQPPKGGDL